MNKSSVLAMTALLLGAAQAAPIQNNTISATIKDWPAGTPGEVRLVVRSGYFGADSVAVFAKAAVDASGKFTLKLPAAAALQKALLPADTKMPVQAPCTSGSCKQELTLVPRASVNVFDLLAFQGDTPLGLVHYRNSVQTFYNKGWTDGQLVFTSAAGNLKGEYYTSGEGSGHVIWDAKLSAGWNWVSVQSADQDKNTGLWPVKASSNALPASAFFFLTEGYGGAGMVVDDGPKGVTVTDLKAGGAAEKAGVQVGDTIVAVGSTSVQNVTAGGIGGMVRGEPGTPVILTIKRGGQTLKSQLFASL